MPTQTIGRDHRAFSFVLRDPIIPGPMSPVTSRTRCSRIALLAALLAALACGPAEEPEPTPLEPAATDERPSFLLVTLDTTRADRIGAYGYAGARTPTLDRLAAEGLLYTHAEATAPLTLPSHASILTGTYPVEHGLRDNAIFVLAPEARTVAEVLQDAGWRTGAFVASDVLGERFGLAQGFAHYDDVRVEPGGPLERPARDVVRAALRWLSEQPTGRPWFAWVHFYDPHRPWQAPEPFASRVADPYDAEIAYVDSELERLLAGVEERRPGERRLVIVAADHGESLGEHGEDSHGVLLYEGVTRVPLILSGSALAAVPGTRSSDPVSLADLAPTLVRVAGLGRESLPDSSLPPLLDAEGRPLAGDPGRALLIESFGPYFTYRWHPLRAVVAQGHKWIAGKVEDLYDLERDPGELNELAAREPEIAASLRARLADLEAAHPPRRWSEGRDVRAEERARLAELGYIAGDAGGDPLDPSLPDPRERIGLIAFVASAQASLEEWQRLQHPVTGETPEQARERRTRAGRSLLSARDSFRQAFEIGRESPFVQLQLGGLEAALGNYEMAIPLLEAGSAGRPDDASARFDLAVAYYGAGRLDAAVTSAERALALDPGADPHHQLVIELLQKQGRDEAALAALDRLDARGSLDAELQSWASSQRARIEDRLRARPR